MEENLDEGHGFAVSLARLKVEDEGVRAKWGLICPNMDSNGGGLLSNSSLFGLLFLAMRVR